MKKKIINGCQLLTIKYIFSKCVSRMFIIFLHYCIWTNANIPSKAKPKIFTQIMKLQYRALQKKVKSNEVQIENETIFKENLIDSFDIAVMNQHMLK